ERRYAALAETDRLALGALRMTAATNNSLTLPRQVRLSDGSEVTLRLLTMADFDAFLAFTTSLPAHDLLFLRTDITDAAVLAGWLENIELGRILTIVAEREGR